MLTVDSVAPGWEPVRDAFVANLASGQDRGAGVAVMHRGRLVVDLMGGHRDKHGDVPYGPDALQVVFSTTKGVTALAVAMCVERGLLDYGERVAAYWPEFAANGKDNITVAELMGHRAGLYTVDGPISLEEALDWDTVTSRLAATAPLFEPGSTHGYHALTYGWLAGELVRRASGMPIGEFVQRNIAGPLGVEFWIGLPAEHDHRVAHLMAHPLPVFPPEIARFMLDHSGPGSLGEKALSLNGAFGQGVFNRPEVRAAQIPGANGIGNARALATIYAATIGEVNGVRLITEETRRLAATSVTPEGEPDVILGHPTVFGKGYMLDSTRNNYGGPGGFGHDGAGGSVACAVPSRGLAVSYVMNTMMTTYDGDPRREAYINAAVRCADAA
ncbi:MAG: class A beta-lactamase-related serine hydrolase [Actinobacteria bacterium]|nr:class A beta-lactamase-related serine hydrolase [Actinomycetota bacterium]